MKFFVWYVLRLRYHDWYSHLGLNFALYQVGYSWDDKVHNMVVKEMWLSYNGEGCAYTMVDVDGEGIVLLYGGEGVTYKQYFVPTYMIWSMMYLSYWVHLGMV